MAVAAGLIIIVCLDRPCFLIVLELCGRTWNKVTRPWQEFTEKMENAVSALESPSGSKRGEFYGSELPLGGGFPLSDMVMFKVQAPDLPPIRSRPATTGAGAPMITLRTANGTPPARYGRNIPLRPRLPYDPQNVEETPAHFMFNTGKHLFPALLPVPACVDRPPGVTFTQPGATDKDIVAWHAYPWLKR